ncbi:MAG: prepilin-type N-terminal cleavage/methylation domain-containing protein [bacterium]|nr:prepilin-type N-terminal cleavage/methylation domain-containing protein [bacterium]
MNKGFTLIELMVSISIIAIVSSAVMVGRNGAEQEMSLRTTVFSLSQNLREYQEKALSGEDVNCGTGKNVCGFGIHFTQNNDFYTPFVDCSNNCPEGVHSFDSNDIARPPISLGKSKICSVDGHNFDVVFALPDPTVYLDNVAWGDEVDVSLCLKANTTIIKKVKLNNAGKIEIQ